MKKYVFIVLLILLLSISSAYAVWTDSVNVEISAESAIINVGYISRNNPSGVDYTLVSLPVSESNPYLSIEETVVDLPAGSTSNNYKVKYVIKNIGTAPVVLKGIEVTNMTFDAGVSQSSWIYSEILDSLRIRYRSRNNSIGYNERVNITGLAGHTGVTFPNYEDNLLYPGDESEIIVKYMRNETGYRQVDRRDVTITKTDRLIFSVYR